MAQSPRDEPVNQADLVDDDNDYVVFSRRGNLVDLSEAIRIGPHVVGARRISNPGEARERWNSNEDDLGNAGIVVKDVLNDSEKW